MKIGIVGGNSQVGTELCLLLRSKGYDVIPIVRSKLASSFLEYNGFACRIADVAYESQAITALGDLDFVVIAAYAMVGSAQYVRETNKNIINNVASHSLPKSKIILFSSIRAFSWKVDNNTPRLWFKPNYDREKKFLEGYLSRQCMLNNKIWWALRLGHVVGDNQGKSIKLKNIFDSNLEMCYININRDRLSNVLHIVTLCDAIECIYKYSIEPGTYSLVNNPQWTWEKVFNYLSPGIEIKFLSNSHNVTTKSIIQVLIKPLWKMAILMKSKILTILQFIPAKYALSIQSTYYNRLMLNLINSYKIRLTIENIREFDYSPIPGPFISELSNTEVIVDGYDINNYIKR